MEVRAMKDDQSPKIISMNDFKNKKVLGELWEYPDSYEYCIIPNYEDKFSETRTECIQIGDCFANIIKIGNHYVLISIIFEKEWLIQEIIDWLDKYEITIFPPTTSPFQLHKTNVIIEAIKFKDCPLVLSGRGTKTLPLDPKDLDEVTELFETYDKITNTGLAKPIEEKR